MAATPKVRESRAVTRDVDTIRRDVARTRRAYLRRLEELPDPLGDICTNFYRQRVNRVSPRPLLGEYLPWLLADLLDLRTVRTHRIASAWLSLYLQVLAVDDLLDDSIDVDRRTLPIAASAFAQRAFAEYLSIFGTDPRFWSRFERFSVATGVAGAREMLVGRGQVPSIADLDVHRIGEKVELVKVCYSSLVLANGLEPDEAHLSALTDFQTAVQLLDDISDWADDFALQSYTPILTRAFQGVEVSGDDQSPVEVLCQLVVSGALGQCLDEAIERLERASAVLPHQRRAGSEFLERMLAETRWLREIERDVARRVNAEVRRIGRPDPRHLVVLSPETQVALDELSSSIKIVAQTS